MMRERTQMRKTLLDHENGSRITYLADLQELVGNEQEREVQIRRMQEVDAAIVAAKARREEAQAEYRRAVLGELAEATRKAGNLERDLAKAEQRTKYQALTAPIAGTVQQLAVHTIGGVVTPAQTLLVIVPSDTALEVEAVVENQDIGFVHPGQTTEIKVDTFNFTRYGLRHGEVVGVSQDAVGRGSQAKPDASRSAQNSGDGNSGAEQGAGFAARVSLDSTQMQVGDKLVNLSPGMAVTVEIKTGRRRIISYLLSPLLRYSQESLRER
jgi:hemolysin D